MASTVGSREVIDSTLSRLIWAIPVNSTGRSPGEATSRRPVSCLSEAGENNTASLLTVRERTSSAVGGGAPVGGPTWVPRAKVPVGELTATTSGTRDSSAAYLLNWPVRRRWRRGTTTITADPVLLGEAFANWSPDLMRRRRGRQHTIVRKPPLDTQERQSQRQQHCRAGQDRDDDGLPHHRTSSTGTRTIRSAVQVVALRRKVASAALPHIECVESRPEQHDRGQRDYEGRQRTQGHRSRCQRRRNDLRKYIGNSAIATSDSATVTAGEHHGASGGGHGAYPAPGRCRRRAAISSR